MSLSSLVVPMLLAALAVYGTGKRVDVYNALTHGAEEGLTVLLRIVPALVGLLTAVSMFRASGAMEWFSQLFSPVLELLGIPAETAPLLLIRPVSGSGALAVATDLLQTYGPDSYVGRVAAVMLGSTETTFYTIAVYFGSAGIFRTPSRGARRPGGGPDRLCRLRAGRAPAAGRIRRTREGLSALSCYSGYTYGSRTGAVPYKSAYSPSTRNCTSSTVSSEHSERASACSARNTASGSSRSRSTAEERFT